MRAAGSMAGRKKAFARQTSLAALIVDLWFLSLSLVACLSRRRASSADEKSARRLDDIERLPGLARNDIVIASFATRTRSCRGYFLSG